MVGFGSIPAPTFNLRVVSLECCILGALAGNAVSSECPGKLSPRCGISAYDVAGAYGGIESVPIPEACRTAWIGALISSIEGSSGGPSRARTWDHLIKSQLLYQLS